MKREDEQYEQWLEKLKMTSPVLLNPEKLTNDIIREIELLPEKVRKEKRRRKWEIVTRLSTTAAGFLLCLLLGETVFFSGSEGMRRGETICEDIPVMGTGKPVISEYRMKDMSLKEKSRWLSEKWKSRRLAERRRKEFLTTFVGDNDRMYFSPKEGTTVNE